MLFAVKQTERQKKLVCMISVYSLNALHQLTSCRPFRLFAKPSFINNTDIKTLKLVEL